jgi:hypothetical protein
MNRRRCATIEEMWRCEIEAATTRRGRIVRVSTLAQFAVGTSKRS